MGAFRVIIRDCLSLGNEIHKKGIVVRDRIMDAFRAILRDLDAYKHT